MNASKTKTSFKEFFSWGIYNNCIKKKSLTFKIIYYSLKALTFHY